MKNGTEIVLVGRDVAPSGCLSKVKEGLIGKGMQVVDFLGNGGPLNASEETIKQAVAKAYVVLTGMSSSPELAREELAAADFADRNGITYGFYADTFGSYKRPWFSHLRDGANFVFVVDQEEAEDAGKYFKNAKIVVSGNPFWEEFCFPRLSYHQTREVLGVFDDEKMILCPGSKALTVNIAFFSAVIDAVHLLTDGDTRKFKIFLAIHPGDHNDLCAYGELVKFSSVPVKIITYDMMLMSDMVPGADIVVESASTVGIEAAHQRKPVIDYFTEIALSRLYEASGSRLWKPCCLGAAIEVLSYRGGPAELAQMIDYYLFRGGDKIMRLHQEKAYPIPSEKGFTVRLIQDTVLSFVPEKQAV